MKVDRFEVTFFTKDGAFPNVNSPIRGYLRLGLKRPMKIRYLMVGWSTRCNSKEVLQEKTRIGKQVYVEKVQFLIGETDSKECHHMEAKEHIYQFEIPNHEIGEVEKSSDTVARLSWHNLKAALVDKNEEVTYADVIALDSSGITSGSNDMQNIDDTDTNELIDISPKLDSTSHSCQDRIKHIHKSHGSDGVHFKQRDLDIQCLLRKPCFAFEEIVSFTVQCRNNGKKGYKNLTAMLVERYARRGGNQRKSKIVASVVGPAVAPKEMVLWEGQLIPLNIEKDSGCWYTLKVELRNKFSTKFIIRVPVVITDSPLTPNQD